jgi:hypothetical protein
MSKYDVNVTSAPSFDAFLAQFPEATLAAASGFKVLQAPPTPPQVDLGKIRCAAEPGGRRPGSKM